MEDITTTTIETLNVEQATTILRHMGMRISPVAVRRGIEQGVFPFGDYIQMDKGTPVYQIYKRLFDAWVAERAVEARAS